MSVKVSVRCSSNDFHDLQDFLDASVVRPLGACGCSDAQPLVKACHRPGRRESAEAEGNGIACGRCERCQRRTSVSYVGTPFKNGRDRQGLVQLCSMIAHYLEGTSNTKAALEMQVWKGIS